MRILNFIWLVVIAAASLSACKDRPHHPELTEYSEPVDGVLPYFSGTQMDPSWPAPQDLPGKFRRMSAANLRADDGRAQSALEFAKGRFSLVTFFYTSCSGICPMITANMKRLSAEIKDQSDLQFISITVDPEKDDDAALRTYRARHQAGQKNWTFLTGSKSEIEDLARNQFAGEIQASADRNGLIAFVHTENVFLLDKEGYLRGVYRARGTGEFPRILKELGELRAQVK